MLPSLGARSAKLRHFIHKKLRQSSRISRKTLELSCLLVGATLVALASLTFAALADYALDANRFWAAAWPLAPWFILPPGMALLAWFTRNHAPYVAGSGIPQVIAALGLPYGANKERLIRLAFSGLSATELIATGAAGGLAAAFNAPLAGIIFAIEELGRGLHLRWERRLLLGVLASGFILAAIKGNNPYFPAYTGATTIPHMIFWVALCGVVCGIAGGIFARLLAKGALGYAPAFLRGWLVRHPVIFAALLGLVLAAIGHHTHGQTYGTGYHTVAQALDGEILQPHYLGPAKLLATVATYWSGIAGGIFTPSLTTGAGIGSGLWVLTGGAADHNLLVLLCTAAFLAGATQSPVTASVVVMEMTGSQPLLIWLMTACLIATPVSRQVQPKPFYHAAAARYRQRLQAENAS